MLALRFSRSSLAGLARLPCRTALPSTCASRTFSVGPQDESRADATPLVVAGALVAGAYGAWHFLGASAAPVSFDVMRKQNAETSSAVAAHFKRNATFVKCSKLFTASVMGRDDEDGAKLQAGIQIAIDKKVLSADVKVESIKKISVQGKTPSDVAREIITALGDAPSKGCVMTLQGLSGTGKGTTVDELKKMVPNCVTWSNGNVFRSLTLLAVTYSEQNNCTLKDALKPELLASFVKMLEFGKFNGKFDVKIEGLGMKYYVSEIMNTKLQAVAKNIPTVAEVTQGEVVNFVQGALAIMAADGKNVLVEGREQTLNYIRSPHRFELVLKDSNIIGVRRASQFIGATAWDELKGKASEPSQEEINAVLERALEKVAKQA